MQIQDNHQPWHAGESSHPNDGNTPFASMNKRAQNQLNSAWLHDPTYALTLSE